MNSLSSAYKNIVYSGFIQSFPLSDNKKNLLSLRDFKKIIEGDANSEAIEHLSAEILRNITQEVWSTYARYRFNTGYTSREKLLNLIFKRSFSFDPNTHIQLVQKIKNKEPFYSQLKTIVWIKIPKGIASIIQNKVFSWGVFIVSLLYASKAYKNCYIKLYQFTQTKILPPILENIPLHFINKANLLITTKEMVLKKVINYVLIAWIFKTIVLYLPSIPYVTKLAQKLNNCALFKIFLFSRLTISDFIFHKSLDFANFIDTQNKHVIYFFKDLSQKAEQEKLIISEKKCLEYWKSIYKKEVSIISN